MIDYNHILRSLQQVECADLRRSSTNAEAHHCWRDWSVVSIHNEMLFSVEVSENTDLAFSNPSSCTWLPSPNTIALPPKLRRHYFLLTPCFQHQIYVLILFGSKLIQVSETKFILMLSLLCGKYQRNILITITKDLQNTH